MNYCKPCKRYFETAKAKNKHCYDSTLFHCETCNIQVRGVDGKRFNSSSREHCSKIVLKEANDTQLADAPLIKVAAKQVSNRADGEVHE